MKKELLNDYSSPHTNKYPKALLVSLLVLGVITLLYAMAGDAEALNNGWIH